MRKLKGIFFFSLFSVLTSALSFSQTVVDEVIAIVGQNMIKYSELETGYIQARSNAATRNTTRCDILDDMLLNKLLLHQADIDSLEVTDAEVEQEIDSRLRYMIQAYGSQEKMEKQMQKSVSEIKAQYHDIIKENILIQQEQSKLVGDVSVTPQEVADFYANIPKDSLPTIEEEYELTQIVRVPVVSQEEKDLIKEKLNSYRNRILQGDKFSTMATLYSDDEASARNGGDLGFFTRGTMVGEFEGVAFSLQPGEVSPVFETKYGFHIVQMIERRGEQIHCRHILLQPKVSPTSLYNAKMFLDSVRNLIESGTLSFEDAVVKFSDDESKISGGLVINKNTASSRFTKDAINETIGNIDKIDFNSMKQGEISKPVEFKSELSDAYRLIKIKKKVEKHTVNLENDFDRLQQLALSEKKMDIMKKWAETLVSKTYIRIDDKYLDCNFSVNWLNSANKNK
ncbi:MAG: peptidylprolyl isomerase [Bacteroidales bacterium]|nr:peptidylprolyl isomerase [Bacteroidales bacterium]